MGKIKVMSVAAEKQSRTYNCYTNVLLLQSDKFMTMNTASTIRKQTSFRLSEELIERLHAEARRHNRSLNNLVESVLMAFVSSRPNKVTLAAMREAETSDSLEELDMKDFRGFVESL